MPVSTSRFRRTGQVAAGLEADDRERDPRDLIPLARSVNRTPSVKIEAVLASDPDTVEMTGRRWICRT
jgi:hypothetical protein